jgi:sulfite reductase alpha subunit-like flavoprotein
VPACRWLKEAASDFRVGSEALKHTRFAVFGCGNSVYGANFNVVAKAVDEQLAALGGSRLAAVGLGDEDAGSMEEQFSAWSSKVRLAAWWCGMC